MKKIILIFLLSASSLAAQNFQQKFDGIPFTISGGNSMAPFNGGMSIPRYQFADIDGDGLKDLFVYDLDTTLNFYKNTGTAENPIFKLTALKYQNLSFKNWFYFVDIDHDGDLDLFAGGDLQTIKYYRNTGSSTSPILILETSQLRSSSDSIIYSEANSVPAFCDINNDGDIDFFTGTQIGAITFYENIGTPTAFSFKYITDLWQNILIISPALDPRHGANALEFADIDADNDYDLFFGDLFSASIYFIKNNGTPTNPDMTVADSSYPVNQPFYSLGYNSVRIADLHNDGLKDLYISVLYPAQGKNNFVYYKNNGTPTVPFFQKVSDNFLRNVDVGGYSNIYISDINNDGLKDIFIGGTLGIISYYRNNGSASQPSFILDQDSLQLTIPPFNYNYSPALADMNGDGLKDLFVGSYIKDSLYYFKNTGTQQNFQFTLQGRGNQIGITNLTQSSSPELADIDGDGDLDFFSGGSNGRIYYYENTGTPQSFNFAFRSDFYLGIDVGNESIPRFFDIDRDGDLDLFIGNLEGKIWFYRNDGTSQIPNFVFISDYYGNIKMLSNSCPFFADIDADTDADLFLGNIKGGMFYFENRDIIGITSYSSEIPSQFILHQNYPNPFNPSTKITFDLPQKSTAKLIIYDASGREIATLINSFLQAGTYEFTWNAASDISSGIYFYRLTASDYSATKKMLFIK